MATANTLTVINTILLTLQVLTIITIIILLYRRKEGKRIMASLSDLIAQVRANTDLEQSAIQCINGLASKLEEARGSQSAIDGVIAEMRAKASALSQAIQANTEPPAPPIEAPPPATEPEPKGEPTI